MFVCLFVCYVYVYRVVSRLAQWPEWIVSVPLCLFIALSCNNDVQSLSKYDSLMVFLMFLVVFNGFLLNLHFDSVSVNTALLAVSCVSLGCIIFLAVNTTNCPCAQKKSLETDLVSADTIIDPREGRVKSLSLSQTHQWMKKIIRQLYKVNLAHKKKNLCFVCVLGLPLFPVIYFLSLYHIINDEWTVVLFSIASLLFKSVLVGVLIAGHSKLYGKMLQQAEALALEIELL